MSDKRESLPEDRKREDAWVIRKRGYYYRANRSGYTASPLEAGFYTQAEAEAEARIEPSITAHRLADVMPLPTEIDTLRAQLAEARISLSKVRSENETLTRSLAESTERLEAHNLRKVADAVVKN